MQRINSQCSDIHKQMIEFMSDMKPDKMDNYYTLRNKYVECESKIKRLL